MHSRVDGGSGFEQNIRLKQNKNLPRENFPGGDSRLTAEKILLEL